MKTEPLPIKETNNHNPSLESSGQISLKLNKNMIEAF